MKNLFFFLTCFVGFNMAFAGETVLNKESNVVKSSGLPTCIDQASTLASIFKIEKENSKSEFKYKGFRDALSSAPDDELVSRLAFSETMAANCPAQNSKILPLIKATIQNRIAKRGDARSVIFQLNQFASSLNNYSESRLKDFLCPSNPNLWKIAMAPASSALPTDSYNYYLYQHNAKFAVPNWANSAGVPLADSAQFESCIKFFKSQFR